MHTAPQTNRPLPHIKSMHQLYNTHNLLNRSTTTRTTRGAAATLDPAATPQGQTPCIRSGTIALLNDDSSNMDAHLVNVTQRQHSCSRRGSIAGLVAAVLLPWWTAPASNATVPRTSVAGENVGLLTDAEIDKKRKKANFKRAHDGHVAVLNKYTKKWTDVKCDLQVPGLLLLREESGQVYYLGYAGLKQVDLSDDQVVAAIAADDWENNMRLVQGEGPDGTIEALEMTREGFYQLVSLVSDDDWSGLAPRESAASKTSDKRR